MVTEKILSALPNHKQNFPQTWLWTDVNGVDYTTPNHNQHQPNHYCGACWVFGSLAVIDDRLKIRQPSGTTFISSHQVLINCGPNFEAGCNGGDSNEAFKWIHDNGIPEASCNNYIAKNGKCDRLGRCQDCLPLYGQPKGQCWGKPEGTYTIAIVEEYGRIAIKGNERALSNIAPQVQKMKAEIYERGPIACAIICTPKMIHYTPYHPWTEGELPYEASVMTFEEYGNNCTEGDGSVSACLDHVVEVAGWGVDNGVEYWLIRNSWGSWWGENGWFRVEVGKNVLGIESTCDWAVPKVLDDYVEINDFVASKLIREAESKRANARKAMKNN